MKKVLCLITVVMILLTGCIYQYEEPNRNDEEPTVNAGQIEQEQSDKVCFEYEDIYVEFIKCEISPDNELFLYFEMTNNSTENASFIYTFNVYAFQNGVGLDSNYIYDCDEEKNSSKEIQPGTTITVAETFELSDSSECVEIEIYPWISFDNKAIYKFTIEIEQ